MQMSPSICISPLQSLVVVRLSYSFGHTQWEDYHTLSDIHGFVVTVAHLVGHGHNDAYCMGPFTVKMCEDHPILGVNGSPL